MNHVSCSAHNAFAAAFPTFVGRPRHVTKTPIDSIAQKEQKRNISFSRELPPDMRTSTPLPVLEALRERIQRLEGGAARRKTVLTPAASP
jgi:hypothetical protein